jgi:hypothetical protein
VGLFIETDFVGDIPHVLFVFLGDELPRLIFPSYRLLVFGDDAISFRDAENKRVAMVLLHLFDSGTVEDNPISVDTRDAWPVHRSEAGRSIAHLLEDLSPIARRASR